MVWTVDASQWTLPITAEQSCSQFRPNFERRSLSLTTVADGRTIPL